MRISRTRVAVNNGWPAVAAEATQSMDLKKYPVRTEEANAPEVSQRRVCLPRTLNTSSRGMGPDHVLGWRDAGLVCTFISEGSARVFLGAEARIQDILCKVTVEVKDGGTCGVGRVAR